MTFVIIIIVSPVTNLLSHQGRNAVPERGEGILDVVPPPPLEGIVVGPLVGVGALRGSAAPRIVAPTAAVTVILLFTL